MRSKSVKVPAKVSTGGDVDKNYYGDRPNADISPLLRSLMGHSDSNSN